MANVALTNVYNYYLTTYAPKSASPFDSHKKSELRNIYNAIVKLNRDAPVYLVKNARESCRFAVGIKENARQLHHTISSLGVVDEEELFRKKVACSSDEHIASACYVGDEADTSEVSPLEIEVRSLASPQVNMGTFLPKEKVTLAPGAYSFDVNVGDLNYEFQYVIHGNESNRDVQERLARLINNADIGIQASILEGSRGGTSLRLQSTGTGLPLGKSSLFTISDDQTSKKGGSVDYFGLNYVSRPPANAQFLLNGEERTAMSNSFTIANQFTITLNGVSANEGEKSVIGLKTDTESLRENIGTLIGGYNSFIRTASKYIETHPGSSRLINGMSSAIAKYRGGLDYLGLNLQEDGSIKVDESLLSRRLSAEDVRENLAPVRDLTGVILKRTEEISLNPMDYVDKKIVAYKRPRKNFITPYMTSAYSGMMFNSYC